MRRGVMFGEVIGSIVEAFAPVNEEHAIFDAVFYPVKAHVDGFGLALFYIGVGDTGSDGIVGLDWGSSQLRVAHVSEGSVTCRHLLLCRIGCLVRLPWQRRGPWA
jgi:hypothetical protein